MKTLTLSEAHKDKILNGAVVISFMLLLLSVVYPPQVSRGGDVTRSNYQTQPLAKLETVELNTLTEAELLPSDEPVDSTQEATDSAVNSVNTVNPTQTGSVASTAASSSQPRYRLGDNLVRMIDKSLKLPSHPFRNGLF